MERSHTFYEDLGKKVRSGAVTDEEIRELFTRQNKRHADIISAIEGENVGGYPITGVNIMEHSELNRMAAENGMESPDYVSDYKEVYRRALLAMGVNWVDQWIPDNPLSMGAHGYEGSELGATTGGETLVLDGIPIEEPEDVVEHLEKCVFPWLRSMIENYDYEAKIREIGLNEYWAQMEMGEEMLKTGHATARFPQLDYFTYGYVNYFCAYVMYSDVIEESFKLQAELARKDNTAVVEAYKRYNLPKIIRLDHDMTDSRTTLVDIKSLERTWFPLADKIELDLKPALTEDILRERIKREVAEMQPEDFFAELVRRLVPKPLVVPICKELDVHSRLYISKVSDKEFERLIKVLKGWSFPISDYLPFEYAVVTAGGVSCSEVNEYTMESLKIKGMYFAGEVLDVDANTGGYNLQIAFSTGHLAGLLKK